MTDFNEIFSKVSSAKWHLANFSNEDTNKLLKHLANRLETDTEIILRANAADLARMDKADPKYDRLLLTPQRICSIAADLREVTMLSSPVGRVLNETTRPNGMRITKTRVPFGVIGVIYEARPNVTIDVFSLCIKSGNVCVLKGGTDAHETNTALMTFVHDALQEFNLPTTVATLLPPDRSATDALLNAQGYVDLIIPRGSSNLINYVRRHATVPVIETGAGICHTYFDADGDVLKGAAIINNAKTRRVSVCNALDCLIIHATRLNDLPALCAPLVESNVVVYADPQAHEALSGHYPDHLLKPATPESFGTEFLSYAMSIKTVANATEALEHIALYSSKHSECIVTENEHTARTFLQLTDAACVYHNVSTAFTDGAQFGMGAEIGISTQKLHARGPMALEELTSYKWIVEGDGQIR